MVKTDGLYHIQLTVRDIERSSKFYREVFGMQELFREGPKMVFLNTPESRDLITLNENSAEAARAGDGGVAHFGFRLRDVAQLDAAVREVERGGGQLIRRGEHAPGAPFAYVRDPDGYVIELG